MDSTSQNLIRVPNPGTRKLLSSFLLALLMLALAFWVSIPLLSPVSRSPEEANLFYMLARMSGLGAAFFILLQYSMSGRIHWLDHIFGLDRLLKAHRVTAVTAAVLATLHPLLMYPRVFEHLLHPSLSHWPLYLGPVLLVSLWGIIAGGLWRKKLRLSFEIWWLLHRVGTTAAVVILALHVLNISRDFAGGWPRWLFGGVLALYAGFYARNKLLKPWQLKKNASFTIIGVDRTGGDDVTLVSLRPRKDGVFPHLPGQFAFVRFYSKAVSDEEHHFTLSSSPTWENRLLYTIKCSGDFSCALKDLKVGEKAILDGPYGLFSHTAYASAGQELVLVAGGIGITPLLSMLRYMADTGDDRKVTLIWSNRSQEDIVCPEEFEELQERLPGFVLHYVMTREDSWKGPTGHVDTGLLNRLLKGSNRDAHCFVCGPPKMMSVVTKALEEVGFKASRIHSERFAL